MLGTENSELSERELEILRLVATGASNKEIAQRLTISTNTVKVHLRNIFVKVGAASRTEAALFAVRSGLVQDMGQAGLLEGADNGLSSRAAENLTAPLDSRTVKRSSYLLPGFAALVLVLLIVFMLVRPFDRPSENSSAQLPPAPTFTPAPNWRQLAEMPTPRSGLAVTAYENHIYAAAGKTAAQVTGVLERFNPDSNTWIELSPKPVPVYEVAGAVIGGLIYVPGGRTSSDGLTDLLEVYDPRQDLWTRRASLPLALSSYALVAFEGRLYIFGGWDGENYLDAVYQYDPNQDQWTELTPMPTPRAYAGAVVAGGKIYVIGGYDGKAALTTNEIYTPDRETEGPWDGGEPMPDGRYGMGAVSVADIIQVIGGETDLESKPLPLAYFPQLEQWQYMEETVFPSGSYLGVVPLGINLFSIGGEIDQVPSGQNQAYQILYTISIPIIVK